MSKILASIEDAELGAARYVSTANRGEILERATAARAEHAEMVAALQEAQRWFEMENENASLLRKLDTLLSRIAPERAS